MATRGEKIVQLRKKLYLTQQALAWRADVSLGTVSRAENDPAWEPEISTLLKFAKALETSVENMESDEQTTERAP